MNILKPLFILLLLCCNIVSAQLPACNGPGKNTLYLHKGSTIYNYDPSLPSSATNPSVNTISTGSSTGLAVSPNINNPNAPSPTFYKTLSHTYYYYDGTQWVNTGHKSGYGNIGAGGGYLYAFDPSGQVWKYDGTKDAQLLTNTLTGLSCTPVDIAADCMGNIYMINNHPTTPQLRMYDTSGTFIKAWSLTGYSPDCGGGSMAIIDDTVYFDDGNSSSPHFFYRGIIGNTTVACTKITTPLPFTNITDMAACPRGGSSRAFVKASVDTAYYCGTGQGISIKATGADTFTWTIISGNGSIAGSGDSVSITPAPDAIVVVSTDTSTACLNQKGSDTIYLFTPQVSFTTNSVDTFFDCGRPDTINSNISINHNWINYNISWIPGSSILSGANTLNPVISPTATTNYHGTVTINAQQGNCIYSDSVLMKYLKPDINVTLANRDTIEGCGIYRDTLQVQVTDTTGWLSYEYEWLPTAHIFNGGKTLNPVVSIFNDTFLILNINLPYQQGGCTWTDTIQLHTKKILPEVDFDYEIKYGCLEDTILFKSNAYSSLSPSSISWEFGDSSARSSTTDPMHIYTKQGVYSVKHLMVAQLCNIFATKEIDTRHPLNANISYNNLCLNTPIVFSGAASEVHFNPVHYYWYLNDILLDSTSDAVSHIFNTSGDYNITLTVKDSLQCLDTFSKLISVNNHKPYIDLGPSDTTICNNVKLVLPAGIDNGTAETYTWSDLSNDNTLRVNNSGLYYVQASNECGIASDSIRVTVNKCDLWLPSAFSPNGDGLNDLLKVFGNFSDVSDFSMSIFNRRGNLVYQTNDINAGWDGTYNSKPVGMDGYYYMMQYTYKGEKTMQKGDITLVR